MIETEDVANYDDMDVCQETNANGCTFFFVPEHTKNGLKAYLLIIDGEKERCPLSASIYIPVSVFAGILILGLLALLSFWAFKKHQGIDLNMYHTIIVFTTNCFIFCNCKKIRQIGDLV